MSEAFGITVVIPTLNRSKRLQSCVAELLIQYEGPYEILVVDQSDEVDVALANLARSHAAVISYHHVAFRGLPKARNFGAAHARFDAILYLDDDVRCYPNLITEHVRSLGELNVGVVGGGIEELRSPGAWSGEHVPTGHFSQLTAMTSRGFSARGSFEIDHAPGGNFSTWRSLMHEAGGFDESLDVGSAIYEETDFCLRVKRLGYRVVFNGEARVVHLAEPRGGCRVPDLNTYLWALGRNRALMIARYLRWYAKPLAAIRLLITAASFGVRRQSPRAFWSCVGGLCAGLFRYRGLHRVPNAQTAELYSKHCSVTRKIEVP